MGAHYVWGATGNYPDMTSGFISTIARRETNETYSGRLLMRPNRLDPARPFLFTAECHSNVIRTCNGKNMDPGMRMRPPFPVEMLRDADGLAAASDNPDRYLWPRINSEPRLSTPIVYGESCLGKQHFDCIGFINYCMLRVVGAAHHPSIAELQNAWRSYPPVSAPYRAGDILAGPGDHHIAFVVDAEQKVHAKSTHFGVVREHIGQLDPGTVVIRPDNDFLRGRYR